MLEPCLLQPCFHVAEARLDDGTAAWRHIYAAVDAEFSGEVLKHRYIFNRTDN